MKTEIASKALLEAAKASETIVKFINKTLEEVSVPNRAIIIREMLPDIINSKFLVNNLTSLEETDLLLCYFSFYSKQKSDKIWTVDDDNTT